MIRKSPKVVRDAYASCKTDAERKAVCDGLGNDVKAYMRAKEEEERAEVQAHNERLRTLKLL